MSEQENPDDMFSQASLPKELSLKEVSYSQDSSASMKQMDKGPNGIIGSRVGNYRILDLLGKGSFGSVYLGQDVHTERLVAIKVKEGAELGLSEGFLHEAKSVARLEHSNIVRLMHVDETPQGVGYIVYEYVKGKTLGERIKPDLSPVDDVVRWIASIADALDFAHRNGVIHRDLSPRNIMINDAGQAKLLDFGLSRLDGNFVGMDQGKILGTPHFISPEQASGKPHWATAHADIFSLGSVLYYALTGHPPFQGTSVFDILERIQSSTPAPPRSLRNDIPEELELACLKALSKEPQHRFSSGGDFANALRKSIVSSKPLAATSTSPSSVLQVIMGIALLLIGIGTVLGAWMQFKKEEVATQTKQSVESQDASASQKAQNSDPEIESLEIRVQLPRDKTDINLKDCKFPLESVPKRLRIQCKFKNITDQTAYAVVYSGNQIFAGKPLIGESVTWSEENEGWMFEVASPAGSLLSPGINMILVGCTKQEVDDAFLSSIETPFANDYKLNNGTDTVFDIKERFDAIWYDNQKLGDVLLSGGKDFSEFFVSHAFKKDLARKGFVSYYALFFVIREEPWK